MPASAPEIVKRYLSCKQHHIANVCTFYLYLHSTQLQYNIIMCTAAGHTLTFKNARHRAKNNGVLYYRLTLRNFV